MKRFSAATILITMALGLAAWAGSTIVENKGDIVALKIKAMTMHEDIKEIKSDVKALLRRR